MKKYILIICLFFYATSNVYSQQSQEQIIDKFFADMLTEKPNQVLDNLYKNMPWVNNIKTDIDKLKSQFSELEKYFGKYNGYVLIGKKEIGSNVFSSYNYILKYERQPIRCTFKFYKPKDTVLLYSFSYDMNLEEELDTSTKIQNMK